VKRHTLFNVLGVLVIASLALAACGTPAAEPTPEPPAATEPLPPTEPAMPPFEAVASLVAPQCNADSIIKEVVAEDAYTVRFTLCKSDPAFLSKIAFNVFGIYPSEWLIETGATGDALNAPVGTGPYMVSDWTHGESITFTAFPDFSGEAPEAETLVFRWSGESAARLLELQAGTVDGIDNVGPSDFAVVESDSNLSLQIREALNVFYIGFNRNFEPFDDVLVRRAIAMGIDRQRIVDTFYPPGSEAASHFTPCAIPNACEGDAWYEFDPEGARALLAEAGFPDGFSTTVTYRDVVRGYLPNVNQVAADIQAQLMENLSIDAELVVMESGSFIDATAAGTVEGLHLLGWGADYPHVTNFTDYHFGRTQIQFGDPYSEIYEVLEHGATIADFAEAAPVYADANNAIRENVPMIPVAHGGSATAYRTDVTNPQASPLTSEYFAVSDPGGRDTFVWMQNAEPPNMFCADETDGEALRACEQVVEALYAYEINGTAVHPALAESCEPNADLTEYICTLRQGITFHDGTGFDANDVVTTFTMGVDASSPMHVGNTTAFEYYCLLWGCMNLPPS
jgi:ABC-type transport system substrate-binding protein